MNLAAFISAHPVKVVLILTYISRINIESIFYDVNN